MISQEESLAADVGTQVSARRPKLVWVVLLWFLLSAGYTILSFVLIYFGLISVTPEQAAYLRGLSLFDYTLSLGISCLNIGGAVSLFMLRRIAFRLFTIALVASLLVTIAHAITRGFVAALGGAGVVGLVIGYGVLIAVCIYAGRLKAEGVLV